MGGFIMQEVKKSIYKTKNGQAFGHVSRLESNNEPENSIRKQIVPHFMPDGKKGIPKGFPAEYRIFGLDTLKDNSKPLFIVEGEKCAHALHGLGFQAVTSLGGSNAVHLADWLQLQGMSNIYLLPDNDEAGEKYMQYIYAQLKSTVDMKLLCTPIVKEKSDVCDWLASLSELDEWNELDSLSNHPNIEAVIRQFEALTQTACDIPAEWAFVKTKGNLRTINANSFGRLNIPERKALLQPLFMEASINMVYAPRGLGKTFFCLACGVAIAQGSEFLKYACEKQTSVVYLDGEMQASIMQERLRLLSDGKMPKDFHIFTPDMQEDDVITPDLATYEGQKLIDELIESANAQVIFIDNISTFMRSGNENDADSWSIVQPWLVRHRSRGRTIILVHHSNKAGDQRGSNKKEDVMDVVVHLSRPDDYIQGEERTRLLIKLTKARHIYGEDAQDVEAELCTSNGVASWSWHVAESSFTKAVMLLKDGILSQQEIAEELKVHKATISKWKKKAEAEGLMS
jgi:5S rRNA maturation endonuclease (ribonuclease M5)